MNKHIERETKHTKPLAAALLIFGTIFTFGSAQFPLGPVQNIGWEIANMLNVSAYCIIMVILARHGYDLVTAGFSLLVGAQGFAIATTANPVHTDLSLYAAVFMLYVPGYLIIAGYSGFARWVRIACVLVCIPFCTEAVWILQGVEIAQTGFVNYSGYILRAIIDVYLIVILLKKKGDSHLY